MNAAASITVNQVNIKCRGIGWLKRKIITNTDLCAQLERNTKHMFAVGFENGKDKNYPCMLLLKANDPRGEVHIDLHNAAKVQAPGHGGALLTLKIQDGENPTHGVTHLDFLGDTNAASALAREVEYRALVCGWQRAVDIAKNECISLTNAVVFRPAPSAFPSKSGKPGFADYEGATIPYIHLNFHAQSQPISDPATTSLGWLLRFQCCGLAGYADGKQQASEIQSRAIRALVLADASRTTGTPAEIEAYVKKRALKIPKHKSEAQVVERLNKNTFLVEGRQLATKTTS